MTPRARAGWTAAAAVAVAGGCAIGVRRDLSQTPVQQVVYDDVCGLQQYFDLVTIGDIKAPRIVKTTEVEKTEGKRGAGGLTTYAFETPEQLETLRRVLTENWKKIPAPLLQAKHVDIEVRWAEKASVRRAVTDQPATISDGADSWRLDYQVCLSELLFGAPLYATRRDVLGMPRLQPRPDAAPIVLAPAPDGGADAR